MNREASWKISYLSFISTGIILLHHANQTMYVDNVPAAKAMIMNFFTYLVIFAMSWFVFISAYLFFRKIRPADFKRKYKARIYTLLLPYLIWNTFAVCLKLLDGDPLFQAGIFGFFRENYFFFNGHGVADGPLWYVFRLFTYLAIAPIIYLICANDRRFIKTGILASALIILNCAIRADYYSFLYFLPVYILGAGIGMNFPDRFEHALEYRGGGTAIKNTFDYNAAHNSWHMLYRRISERVWTGKSRLLHHFLRMQDAFRTVRHFLCRPV